MTSDSNDATVVLVAVVLAAAGGTAAWLGGAFHQSEPSADPGVETDTTAPDESRTVDALDAVDLTGTWAERSVKTSIVDVPIVGTVEGRIESYRRVEIRQEGAELRVESLLCDTTLASDSGSVRTVLPETFVETAPVRKRSGRARSRKGRLVVELARTCGVRGAELSDPAGTPLPTSPDAPSVVDGDGDGRPGVTLRVEGTVSGRMSMVQRGCDAYRGTLRSTDRIRGTVQWSSNQTVLHTNNVLLRFRPTPEPHPEPEKSWFVWRRTERASDCRELLSNRDTIFSDSLR